MVAETELEHEPELERATGDATNSEIRRLYGVSLRTIRSYEDKGLLSPRRVGTARFYSASDRLRLSLILRGKQLGFTLSEISELLSARSLPQHLLSHRPPQLPYADATLVAATETFGSADKARRWLQRPTQIFGGMTPMQVLATVDGAHKVDDVLKRIDHGLVV